MEVFLNNQSPEHLITLSQPKPKPQITSIKHYSAYDGFKKYQKKSKQPIQLQSFMSQLISDNPIIYNIVQKQDLDHFDRLKKLNQMHCLDLTNNKTILMNNYSINGEENKSASSGKRMKSMRPFSSLPTHKSYKTLIVPNKCEDSNINTESKYKQLKSKNNYTKNSFANDVKDQNRSRNIKLRRSDILHNIQKRSELCLQKFIEQNQKKEIFEYIDELIRELQVKSREEISNLYLKSVTLEQEKTSLQKQILELKYKICCLERKDKESTDKINQLTHQHHNLSINYNQLSKFSKDFEAIQGFQPGMNCKELIAHYIKMEELCLNKLQSNDDTQIRAYQSSISKFKEQISSLKLSYNNLCNNLTSANRQLKQRRSLQKQQQDNKNKLLQTSTELKLLQNRLVEFYNNWYQNREKTIKGILKQMGCFKKEYSYFEMIEYMEMDLKNLSTPCKVEEYLRRILATVQLAQRKVFPNVAPETKIDPCRIVNDIVNYTLSIRVGDKRREKQRKGKGKADKENEDIKYITQI